MGQLERKTEDKRSAAKGRVTTKDAPADWVGFVDVELSDADKKALKARSGEYGDAWTHVMEMLDDGYKMTLSYDERNTTYNCSLTGRVKGTDNAGLTLTGRGGTVQGAIMSFWYKDTVVLKGVWNTRAGKFGRQLAPDDLG